MCEVRVRSAEVVLPQAVLTFLRHAFGVRRRALQVALPAVT